MSSDISLANDSIFNGLTEGEKALLSEIFREAYKQKVTQKESRQIREIIPVQRWLESEYYVGPDGSRLYDFWKQEIADVFTTGPYNEVIIQGSIGTGKSTAALYILLRKLYELSCYENVSSLFSLMSTAWTVFMYFSVSKIQAELSGYGQFRSIVDSIPYFHEHFARDDRISSILTFPEKILFTHGSDGSHVIGLNMIGSILDEGNFFQGETNIATSQRSEYSKVASMYTSIINRGRSRFLGNGRDSSLSILVSSPTHASSFVESRIISAAKTDTSKVIKAALWDTKPKGTYSPQVFYVFKGSPQIDPFVVNSIHEVNQFLTTVDESPVLSEDLEQSVETLPPHLRDFFVGVPEDFRGSFDLDVIQSLQEIAGVSVAPLGRLFTSRPALYRSFMSDRFHPFTKDEITISTEDDIRIEDFLRPDWTPRDPHKQRFIHIDQSINTDCTGQASVYIDRFVEVKGVLKPVVALDFALRINPPRPPAEISVSKVRDFVIYYKDKFDLSIGAMSYDQYASAESKQTLRQRGIAAEHQSVDRTDAAYVAFCHLLYEGRFECYEYQPIIEEIFDLVHDRARRKVDHSSGSKKDVMDGIVGAVHLALSSEIYEQEQRRDDLDILTESLKIDEDADDEKAKFEDFLHSQIDWRGL